MKLLLLPVLMALFTVAQVSCEENDPKEEADYWASSNQIQIWLEIFLGNAAFDSSQFILVAKHDTVHVDGWLPNDPFREILLRMTRKPRPHQFIGLMGKRSMANAQITHKRHKVNSFVGLMGKRSQEEPEAYEWSTLQTYDRRR